MVTTAIATRGSCVEEGFELVALPGGDRAGEQDDFWCPGVGGGCVDPGVVQVGGAGGAHGGPVLGGPLGQVVQDAPDGGQVADAAGLQGVLKFGVAADDGDLQVVGPAGGGQLDGQRGEHVSGVLRLAGDVECAEVLQVQEHVPVFVVVADGDQGRVGGGDIG